jgi:ABC-type phosphate transport system substrate-binding protein
VLAGAPQARSQQSAAETYAVIVSPEVRQSDLAEAQLRDIFTFEQRFWAPGKQIVLLLPPVGSGARQLLLSRLYGTNESGLKRLILSRLYEGSIDAAPKVTDADAQAVQLVAATSGTIAVVPLQAASAATVKILKIGGRLPSESGYPLSR